jgi:release factor glutamine methyltransferase
MQVREAIAAAAARLGPGSDTPRLDAELLMALALGVEREALLLSDQSAPTPEAFEALVARREAGEPVAYITGRRAFWTIELAVAPGVLIPRPDSETLIEAAVAHFGRQGPRTVVDLGTGSGALLLAALDQWPTATGLGVDRSPAALGIASANAQRLGMAQRATFRRGDWFDGIDATFDLMLCNPPYVEANASLPRDVADWEPAEALFAGPDGLDDYRLLAPQIGARLAEGGLACVEIGAGQEDAAGSLFAAAGLEVICRRDLAGRPRCLEVRRQSNG